MTDLQADVSQYIISLLEDGVPTAPIAKAFSVDQFTVKSLQATLRTKRYGSSEIAELLSGLMFEAYEEAKTQIRAGSPATKFRMISLVLSRALPLVGKQSPEEFERLRAEMQSMLSDISTSPAESPSLYPNPTFSPTDDVEEDDGA